ncbi:MAG: hypothetical protein ACD_46C00484G0019 [uncultured bacterium]|nr:MAG: hypothetical protein ACD_46C00484G0019 [uncultured bacterium]
MIELIINSYLSIFVSIGTSCILIFVIGIYWIFKKPANSTAQQPIEHDSTLSGQEKIINTDLTAISGDDVVGTQLDLARAFIEIENKQSAKKILEQVVLEGNTEQQDEARFLLGLI